MNELEPVTAMFTLLVIFTSPQVAEVLAPYIVIVIGSFTGASWSLGAMEKKLTWADMLFFYVKSIFTAMLITVPLSYYVMEYIGSTEVKWLFAPVAFVIGTLGYRWTCYAERFFKSFWKNLYSFFKDLHEKDK